MKMKGEKIINGKKMYATLSIQTNLLGIKKGERNAFKNNNYPPMLTIKEAAATVGISCYAIRQMVLKPNCHIKFIKCGSKYLINLDSLVNYLNTGEPRQEVLKVSKIKRIEV